MHKEGGQVEARKEEPWRGLHGERGEEGLFTSNAGNGRVAGRECKCAVKCNERTGGRWTNDEKLNEDHDESRFLMATGLYITCLYHKINNSYTQKDNKMVRNP